MSFDLKLKNGDIVINKGALQTVTSQEKLIQDILKIVLTEAGSNKFYPWYGSYLSKALVGSATDKELSFTMAKNQLQNTLESLKKLQQTQANSFQSVDPREQISMISEIKVNQSTQDPRITIVEIHVLDKSMSKTKIGFSVNTK